ncbi:hypothetical protein L5515_005543 [Caenorhabditis briggsae]|uniref:Uncharacterized protein n=1 Tax=Caenorhabditis briggsae TaxID=6238 RepID=A0AAE9JEB2_CAEBR|nr:hypothetical protein L5515_005543 [Caenorhabditis briggsae]
MILPKLLSLLLILMVLKESSAVRGALFRSGRSVPFERAPGQQKSAPICRDVQLFVPCLFTFNRNCMIDKICVHEAPVTTQTPPVSISTPNPKREEKSYAALSLIGPPRRNDFLRFGRASGAERVGEPQDEIKYGSYGGDADILY